MHNKKSLGTSVEDTAWARNLEEFGGGIRLQIIAVYASVAQGTIVEVGIVERNTTKINIHYLLVLGSW